MPSSLPTISLKRERKQASIFRWLYRPLPTIQTSFSAIRFSNRLKRMMFVDPFRHPLNILLMFGCSLSFRQKEEINPVLEKKRSIIADSASALTRRLSRSVYHSYEEIPISAPSVHAPRRFHVHILSARDLHAMDRYSTTRNNQCFALTIHYHTVTERLIPTASSRLEIKSTRQKSRKRISILNGMKLLNCI